jgi:AraC family transcriptional regulator of arabinose operon
MAGGLRILRTGRFNRIASHFCVRPAGPDYLLIWVIAGRGFSERGEDRVDAVAGSLIAYPPGPPQTYGADPADPWDILWMHFDGPEAAAFFDRWGVADRLDLRLGLDATIRDRFIELIVAQQSPEPNRPRLCDCLGWGLLGLIDHRLAMLRDGAGPDTFERLQRVQAYVAERLAEPLPIESLAAVAGVSPRQLRRLFAASLGTTPVRYVIEHRLARASALLSETTMPVQQVAEASGFEDPYYFSRQFRQRMGESPSGYRSKSRRIHTLSRHTSPKIGYTGS